MGKVTQICNICGIKFSRSFVVGETLAAGRAVKAAVEYHVQEHKEDENDSEEQAKGSGLDSDGSPESNS